MGNGPGAKIPEKWEENGKKMENGPRPEMAIKMEKWTRKSDFGLILAISVFFFSAISGVGPFSIFFPFFWDFCSGPVSHSVNGHFNRGIGDKRIVPPNFNSEVTRSGPIPRHQI